jgi:DNA-binding response OmpR family regulator
MQNSDSTVLVVEDDAELNRLMGAYVSLCGCRYRSALTGGEAVSSAKDRTPSLVLLDLMLPDIDGFEVCRHLRAAKATRDVPIVIVSALSGENDVRYGRECGANDYLTKPVAPDRLIKTIKHYARNGS